MRALWRIPSIAKSMTRCSLFLSRLSGTFPSNNGPRSKFTAPAVNNWRGLDKAAVLNFMQKQYGTKGSTLASLSADNCPSQPILPSEDQHRENEQQRDPLQCKRASRLPSAVDPGE
jgi:hypothetical protein